MFSELHTRSAFSFLSSGSQPEDLAVRAAELGIDNVALIDRDTVAGAVRFHFEAREQGIKAIIGSEITLEDGSLLPLVPLKLEGYQNLAKLITTIKLRNKKGEHFATRRDIEEHSAGLMCFTGGADGFMHRSVKDGTPQADLAWLNYVFPGRLYVELQRHHLRHEEAVNQTLLGLAHKLRLPLFASNGAYYADERARELYDVFTCIKNHTTIYNAGRLLSENSERYIKSEAVMRRLFDDMPEAVDITREIADRVDFSMDELGYTFPDYPVPPGETMDTYLKQLVESGAVERYGGINAETRAKLDKELGLIRKLKLAGYFLVVWDISDFCKREKILSQGRGSAANSVVCYALGITAVDPIKAQLLFERFLSEERGEYPDIDIDLPSGDDRERVIQYVYQKYGRRGAAMTANVISYRGRSAIREVGKVFGFDADALTRLSKLNPYFESFKGEELHAILREQGFDTADERRVTKFAELYTRILDFPRHLGQHSGGMVISLGRLDGVVPIEPASMDGRTIIQWDKDDCERLGIIKVDLLGLGMMAVLRDTIELVRDHYGDEIGLYKIPPDDPKVYKALQEADTIGMFQVESRAQIAFLPKSRPETFYDIVVQVAIIRPGPVVGNMLSSYIKRRQGIEPVDYIHPRLEQTLKRTLGVPLFQEQLLKIAMDIADFTGGQAEELRRAMGFKRADRRLISIEEKLRAGMTRNDIDTSTQDRIVDSVKAFANYGFPESHAASFALLAYASAYFILHYRAAFMVAMFNNYPLGFYSAATLVKDAQRHGLHFLPVDINHSDYTFKIEDEKVRVGLKYIRGLRQEVGMQIESERGHPCPHPFNGIDDLIRRVPSINKREIRALSMAGALNFDGTIHRREALWQTELAMQSAGDLFENTDNSKFEIRNSKFLTRLDGLDLVEADLKKTGISIGKHPLAFLREELRARGVLSAIETKTLPERDIVSVAGAVVIRQRPSTAKEVVFLTLEDETGHSNFVVMPDVFERFRAVINQNDFLVIRGIAERDGMIKALYFEPISGRFRSKVESHNFR
jgi:error-prone DNA polymerase